MRAKDSMTHEITQKMNKKMNQTVFRQRSPLGLAAVSGVTGVVLLVSLARNWASYPRPLFAAWVLLGLALAWSLFVRPAVLLDREGVTVRNVLRDIHLPWDRLTHVETRWNLKIFVGERGYSCWAISSQAERPRPRSGGLLGTLSSGQSAGAARASHKWPEAVSKVTAISVARSIEQAKREYAEAVVASSPDVETDGPVRVTWVPLAAVVLLVPAIAVVVLSLI